MIVCTGQHWIMVRYDMTGPGQKSIVIMETFGPERKLEGTETLRSKLESQGWRVKTEYLDRQEHLDGNSCGYHVP